MSANMVLPWLPIGGGDFFLNRGVRARVVADHLQW